MSTSTLRKVVIHRRGGYEQLRIETHPTPTPNADEVLVDVAAIGVNYADCVVRMGLYSSAREYVGWPITPGFEFAGYVREDPQGRLAQGTPLLGVTRFGAYATQIAVPRTQLFPVPPGLSLPEAAALPVMFLTAHYALHELARPHPGATILVHAAAGGVGSALIQLGKRAESRVVAVVGRSHKVAAARALGADAVIDKSCVPLWREAERLQPSGYEVILDANGVATLRESYQHLARPGKLVIYGFHSMLPRQGGRPNWLKLALDYLRTPRCNPLDLCTQNRSVLAFNLSYLFTQQELLQRAMGALLGQVTRGELRLPQVTTYGLSQVAAAHQRLESGETVGKLVLLVEDQ